MRIEARADIATNTPPDIDALNHWLSRLTPGAGFRQLTELLPSTAVFVVDAEQRIIFWSSGAEKLLGFRQHELLGQHCLKANRCHSCLQGCGLMESGHLSQIPLRLYRADGSSIKVRKYAQAFHMDDGGFAGGIEVLTADSAESLSHERQRFGERGYQENFYGILSRSPMMQQVFQIIQNTAETEATVLVRGESGTGKELVATAVHTLSHRSDRPFLAVNCATLSAHLLESELFGHIRGAFTGAIKDREGLFRQAEGGTVFLDEIAELPLALQAKLLRVLQERELTPVGGDRPLRIDVRIVAATHRSLREEVRAGRFREDLMYRLRVVPIFLPPLRERREDIGLLLWHFIEDHNEKGPRQIKGIAPEAMRTLLDYHWPGNIRELQNVVEYAFAVGRGSELIVAHLPPEFREPVAALRQGTEGIEEPRSALPLPDQAAAIRQALQDSGGKVQIAAERLGMSRATFWRKRKQYGI